VGPAGAPTPVLPGGRHPVEPRPVRDADVLVALDGRWPALDPRREHQRHILPEILQALTFGPIIRTVFGEGNPNAPVYVVLMGGVCLALAALRVSRVDDPAGTAQAPAVAASR
jgi:hypothetical protein